MDGGGGRRGADLRIGGLEDGIAIIVLPITFIAHNQMSNGLGANGGWVGGGGGGTCYELGGGGTEPLATNEQTLNPILNHCCNNNVPQTSFKPKTVRLQ